MKLTPRRRRISHAELLDVIESKDRERDQTYQDAHLAGWLEGYEQGLREHLDDARAALGRVA